MIVMNNNINIFSNINIPIFISIIGILIILSDFIKINSMRKVTLKNRTTQNNKKLIKILTTFIQSILNKSSLYIKLLDIMHFNMGYFSSESESNNRKKSEDLLVKWICINIFIFSIIIIYPGIWVSKILYIFSILLLEYIVLKRIINKKKEKLKDQFPILVREFIEGYALTNNVKASFEYIVKEIPPIYQIHINRLITQLSSTSTVDEAFMNFNKRISYSMCSSFISIVQSAYSTKKNIINRLIEYQEFLNEETISNKAKKIKIRSFSNNIIIWIVAIIIELYAVGAIAKTSTGNFFFTTSEGQNLLFFSIVSIVFSLVCIRISESV